LLELGRRLKADLGETSGDRPRSVAVTKLVMALDKSKHTVGIPRRNFPNWRFGLITALGSVTSNEYLLIASMGRAYIAPHSGMGLRPISFQSSAKNNATSYAKAKDTWSG